MLIPFPAPAPEPEQPEPATPPPNIFGPFDDLVRGLMAAVGDKTAREALNDLLDKPAKDVLNVLLSEGDQP